MFNGCDECTRLWQEHASAINEHIRLDDKLERASIAHDGAAVQELRPKVEAAASSRADARTALREHEATAHHASDSE